MRPLAFPSDWSVDAGGLPLSTFCNWHPSLLWSYLKIRLKPTQFEALHVSVRGDRAGVVLGAILLSFFVGLGQTGWVGVTVIALCATIVMAGQAMRHLHMLQRIANSEDLANPGSFYRHAQDWIRPLQAQQLEKAVPQATVAPPPRRRM